MPGADLARKVVDTLHKVLESYLNKGIYGILFEGVDVNEVARELNVTPNEVCTTATRSRDLIVVERRDGSCRLLTREADTVRAALTSTVFIDFKVRIIARKAPRLYEACSSRYPCTAALMELLRGLDLEDNIVNLLANIFKTVAQEFKGPSAFTTPFLFQVDAWKHIFRGLVEKETDRAWKAVAILAGTGEGKTEAFLVPLLLYLITLRARRRRGRILLLYPRKALASDQLDRIVKLLHTVNKALFREGFEALRVAILDGDTPRSWLPRSSAVYIRDEKGREKPLSTSLAALRAKLDKVKYLIPYRPLRCPQCGGELVIAKRDYLSLAGRDADWTLSFIRSLIDKRFQELKSILTANPLTETVSTPKLTCNKCNTTFDFIYLTKSDIVTLADSKPPDIIIASIDAVGAWLGDLSMSQLFNEVDAVVVDEAHTITGLSGAHYTMIIRRVLYAARHRRPMLVLSSATISNANEMANTLCPKCNYSEIDASKDSYRDPRKITGYTYFLFIVPSEAYRPVTMAVSAAIALVASKGRALAFTESRRDAEELAQYLAQRLEETQAVTSLDQCGEKFCLILTDQHKGVLRDQLETWRKAPDWRRVIIAAPRSDFQLDRSAITFHHAGLRVSERKEIEAKLKSGELKFVASTSTLELGIDIGELDAILLLGFPATPASFYQRAGRAGRRPGSSSVIITILRPGYRDLYWYNNIEAVLNNPRKFFAVDIPVASAVEIAASHTLSAALDEVARKRRVGTSPSTLSTASLAASLGDPSLADMLKTLVSSKELRETMLAGVHHDIRSHIEDMAKAAIEVFESLNWAVREVPSLPPVLFLAAVAPWEVVRIEKQTLQRYAEEAYRQLASLAGRLLSAISNVATTEPYTRSSSARPASAIAEIVEYLARFARIVPPSALAQAAQGLLSFLASNAYRIALLEALTETLGTLSFEAPSGGDDISFINLHEILRRVQHIVTTIVIPSINKLEYITALAKGGKP